jgi:hypothetical protein
LGPPDYGEWVNNKNHPSAYLSAKKLTLPRIKSLTTGFDQGSLTLNLADLRIEGRAIEVGLGGPLSPRKLLSEYNYDASQGTFERVVNDARFTQAMLDQGQWLSSITRADFLALLEDFLAILPTRRLE